jgi:hypothetical protein
MMVKSLTYQVYRYICIAVTGDSEEKRFNDLYGLAQRLVSALHNEVSVVIVS